MFDERLVMLLTCFMILFLSAGSWVQFFSGETRGINSDELLLLTACLCGLRMQLSAGVGQDQLED